MGGGVTLRRDGVLKYVMYQIGVTATTKVQVSHRLTQSRAGTL